MSGAMPMTGRCLRLNGQSSTCIAGSACATCLSPIKPGVYEDPDAFVQMPPTLTRSISKIRYMTEPLPRSTLVGALCIAPLRFHRPGGHQLDSIAQGRGTGLEYQERRRGKDSAAALPERQVAKGFLKASSSGTLTRRSQSPWKPWRPLTKKERRPVVPGEITEYVIEVLCGPTYSARGTASAWISAAWTCLPARPALPIRRPRPTIFAAARLRCTRYTATRNTRHISCCPSFPEKRLNRIKKGAGLQALPQV